MRTLVLLCLLAAAAGAESIALVGGTLVNPDGPPVPNAVVLIEKNRITAAGPAEKIALPAGARRLRVDGKWIIPGLIDAHVHFFQSGGLYTRPDVIDLRKKVPYADELKWIEKNLDDTFRRYLLCGITSVADVGGPFWNYKVRERARKSPAAPRVAVTGPLVSTYQPDALTTDDPPILKVDTPAAARALVRRQLPHKPDFIKIWYIVRRGETPADHLPIIEATIDESHRNGVRVAIHATQLETARAAVKAGCDILVHSVFGPEIDDAFIELAKKSGVVYTTTLVVNEGYREVLTQQVKLLPVEHRLANPYVVSTLFDLRHLPPDLLPGFRRRMLERPPPVRVSPVGMRNAKRLFDAGVHVAAGTDAGNIGTLHGPSLFREFEILAQAGLSPAQILKCATIEGARVMGKEMELGTIAPGRLADLVVLDADPLRDILNTSRIHLVIKDGKVFRPEDLMQETPADVVQRQVNAYNARDADAFAATYAEDIELYTLGKTEPNLQGRAKLHVLYADLFAKSPKLHCEITTRIVQGRFVIDHERVTGRLEGKETRAVATYEVKDGLIWRVWFAR